MRRETLNLLNQLGFEIQETSFGHLTENEKLHYLKLIDLPDNEVVNILKYFPDLFVMHREINPKEGSFFVVFLEKNKDISEKAQKLYKKFFPHKIMIVSGNSEHLYAKWFHTSKRPEPLLSFIQKEIGVKKSKK